jgi:hypothetical protein
MHGLFPGSGLLVANTSGVSCSSPIYQYTQREKGDILRMEQHCAHFQKSACVVGWEKRYMRDGTLPPTDTVCEVEVPNLFLVGDE